MRLRLLSLVAIALVGACGPTPVETPPPPPPPTTEVACSDGADDDADGLLDCDDPDCDEDAACLAPPPPPCQFQADCGYFARICHEGKCVAPGPFNKRTGEPETVAVKVQASFDTLLSETARRPASVLLRLLDPRNSNGTTLTCDTLLDPAATTAEKSLALDEDATLNHLWRHASALTWSADATFSFEAEKVSRATGLLLLAEAFSGALVDGAPTGERAAVVCVDGVDLTVTEPGAIALAFAGEAVCADVKDDDGDGLLDCDDRDCAESAACLPPTGPSCTAQSECGNIILDRVSRACLGGQCITPGPRDENGNALLVSTNFSLSFDPLFSQAPEGGKPKSIIIRVFHPELLDGSPLDCDGLKARAGAVKADRTKLEGDAELNQLFRNLVPLVWGGTGNGGQVFQANDIKLPRGKDYLLYGEAWYGAREGELPTATLASSDCKVLPDLTGAPDGTNLGFFFKAP